MTVRFIARHEPHGAAPLVADGERMDRMRLRLLLLPLGLLLSAAGPAPSTTAPSTTAPSTTVPGPNDPCVDVTIGGERSLACVNQQLSRSIPPRNFTAGSDLPQAGNVTAPAAGTFNQAATAERLGTSFGHSVVPQRPPPPVYSAPLLPGR
jgi:hypothetical protein